MKDEAHEKINPEVDENDLYDFDKRNSDEKEWRKRAFEINIENIYDIKRQNGMTLYMKTK